MTLLSSFEPGMRVIVFGATGAMGSALCQTLEADDRAARLFACARGPMNVVGAKTETFKVDVTDESAIAAAALQIGAGGSLDLVIVATGVLHEGDELQPEKTWREFTPQAFARAFAVNATGPALIAKHFLPLLARDRRAAFAVLSARVGSIEDNRLGGWTAYRASKAALHQIVRTASIELARKTKTAICVSLHPGTVDSRLSAPFQRGVAPEKLFSPAFAAERLLNVINGLTSDQTGRAFAWDGERIPF